MTGTAMQENRSFTAPCGEGFPVCALFFLLLVAGIARSVPVLLFRNAVWAEAAVWPGVLPVFPVSIWLAYRCSQRRDG